MERPLWRSSDNRFNVRSGRGAGLGAADPSSPLSTRIDPWTERRPHILRRSPGLMRPARAKRARLAAKPASSVSSSMSRYHIAP